MLQSIVLMTATIAPGNCPGARFDVQTRLNQYLRAFRFYCKKMGRGCFDKLLFCDNSGYGLACFKECVPDGLGDRVEIMSLPPEEFTPEFGKGYNEALLIDLAMRKSKLITEAHEDALIVKVTGRYSILNIGHFFRFFRRRTPKFHVDIKNHQLYSMLGLHWNEHYSDTRLIAFTKSFYQVNLLGRYSEVCDVRGITLEQFYYDVYTQFKDCAGLSFRARQDLFIDGFNGHPQRLLSIMINPRWQMSVGHLKSFVRTVLRYVFPSFWC